MPAHEHTKTVSTCYHCGGTFTGPRSEHNENCEEVVWGSAFRSNGERTYHDTPDCHRFSGNTHSPDSNPKPYNRTSAERQNWRPCPSCTGGGE